MNETMKYFRSVIDWRGLCLCCWAVGANFFLLGQTTIYSESFGTWINGAPSNWTQVGIGPGWLPADSLPGSSRPSLAGCDAAGTYLRFPSASGPSGQFSSMISPSLNLTASAFAALELQLCLINPGPAVGEGDGIAVWTSGDGGVNWIQLGIDSSVVGSWTTMGWPIPAAAKTNQFRIRIDGFGDGALLDVGIDRVRIVNPAPPCPASPSSITAVVPAFVCLDGQADVVLLTQTGSQNSSYTWMLADTLDRLLTLLPTAQIDFNGYSPGAYRLYGISYVGSLTALINEPVQDIFASGCAILSQNFLSFQISELLLTTTITSNYSGFAVSYAAASDGSAQVEVLGGSGHFRFEWSGNPGASGSLVTDLPGGMQTVTVTDTVTGCWRTDTLQLSSPDPLVITMTPSPIRCFGTNDGRLQASLGGGVPPYTWRWSHDTTLVALEATGLKPGTYSLTVTDLNGHSQELSVVLSEPEPLIISIDRLKPVCPGREDGLIVLEAAGGTSPYEWQWGHGPTGSTLSGLSPGGYAALVQDARGCDTFLNMVLPQAPQPMVIAEATHPRCFGDENGEIRLVALEGLDPFYHVWEHGAQGAELAGLSAGNYRVFSTDANGCQDTTAVTLLSPPFLRGSVTSSPDSGSGTGTATVSIQGGSAPYRIFWSNGDSASTASGLFAGVQGVLVQDRFGCEWGADFELALDPIPDCLAPDMGFSPNQDGINDRWELPCIMRYDAHEVQVFNRWGQRVFFSQEYRQNWEGEVNGAPLADGTYFYVILLEYQGRRQEWKGTLSIVR